MQPSSVAAERVFSLQSSFTHQQNNSLEDYIEASIMLQYNFKALLWSIMGNSMSIIGKIPGIA